MSIHKKFLLILLFLSVILTTGIIVPGYFKIRSLEFNEAKEYSLSSSMRMANEVNRSIQVLTGAGVSKIETYIEASQSELIAKYKESAADPRAQKAIMTTSGNIVYQGSRSSPLPWTPALLAQVKTSDSNTLEVRSSGEPWLVSFQKNPSWDWYLLSGMPAQEAYRESRDYLKFVLFISLLALMFVALLYFVLTQPLRKRLYIVMEYLKVYKEGNFEKRFKVSAPDEIGKLQQGINSVIDSVEMEIISRKTTEEVLSDEKSKAENSNIAKAENLARLNQVIKNPLTSILGFSKLLSQDVTQDKREEYRLHIEHASADLQTLIEQTLAQDNAIDQNDAAGEPNATASYFELSEELEVVLIESDSRVTEYVKAVLEKHAVTVHQFSDPADALDHIEETDIDLLMVSLTTTPVEGEKAIMHVRSDFPKYLRNLPIVAIVSEANEAEIERVHSIGACDVLTKPFTPFELEHIVARLAQSN